LITCCQHVLVACRDAAGAALADPTPAARSASVATNAARSSLIIPCVARAVVVIGNRPQRGTPHRGGSALSLLEVGVLAVMPM